MAKAHITLPDGTSIKLEGTPDEIASAIVQVRGRPQRSSKGGRTKPQRLQLVDLLANLIDGGFFRKKPQDLAAVKSALEEMGHHYPVTTLSGAMLRQVRSRNLRRVKQNSRWMYTG